MKTWEHETTINAPIEEVWQLFDGPVEKIKKVMPNIISIEQIKETESQIGNVYRQRFKNGKRIQTYDVETLEYQNGPDYKKLKTKFTIPRMMTITTLYSLQKIEEGKVKFYYESTNEPLRLRMRILQLFVGKKHIISFVDHVKAIAESDY